MDVTPVLLVPMPSRFNVGIFGTEFVVAVRRELDSYMFVSCQR